MPREAPAVANVAVVPKPDAERGAVVKAYVVLAAGFEARRRWSTNCRSTSAPACALRVSEGNRVHRELPMTTTGRCNARSARPRSKRAAGAEGH